jgi:predicted DNA repair protein MutK
MPSSLLALLDDIASVLDDVSAMTKVAAQKTAPLLGDDLALNAEQVSGVRADRELPVVWAVAKGSLLNKAILVPAALLLSAFAPWVVTPLMVIGGLYLCYEGAEKLGHRFLHANGESAARREQLARAMRDPSIDVVALEKAKVKGAIRTDFILSAEIIVIALGTVAASPLPTRIAVVAGVALLMTVGVYGVVAGIVKLDDGGLALTRSGSEVLRALGRGILKLMPWLMKALSVAGTAAMFLVGGGILTHSIPVLHHLVESLLNGLDGGGVSLANLLANLLAGVVAGTAVLLVVSVIKKVHRGKSAVH